jgi:hypothetical protein
VKVVSWSESIVITVGSYLQIQGMFPTIKMEANISLRTALDVTYPAEFIADIDQSGFNSKISQ